MVGLKKCQADYFCECLDDWAETKHEPANHSLKQTHGSVETNYEAADYFWKCADGWPDKKHHANRSLKRAHGLSGTKNFKLIIS